MNFNARIVEINNLKQAQAEVAKIQCDQAGANIMSAKAVFKTIKVEKISTKAANLLKQTFLSKGGEVVVARGAANLSIEYTDVLICATLKQYRLALPQLKIQPWGLAKVAEAIAAVLNSNENFPLRTYTWPRHTLSITPGKTLIMGILNVTPDSFSDGGKFSNIDVALRHVEQMVADGADIIDIGAESTRPYGGAEKVSAEQELERLVPILEKVLAYSPVPISIDTYKAQVAEETLKMGAHMINDVWGLQHDAAMAEVVAKYKVPLIAMHNQTGTQYEYDIISHICGFFQHSIALGMAAGMDRDQFILDPGIGFGKTGEQNLVVMSRLEEIQSLGCPVLLAASRKRFIGEVLDLPVDDRVEGTGATVALGITKGVQLVRVHDVKAIARIAKMMDAMTKDKIIREMGIMNKILLQNMMFYGFHGVHEYEREQGQRFYVDVEMVSDLSKASDSDDLNDTVDYTAIYSHVKEVMETHRFQLLEALSAHIAESILHTSMVREVTIRIRKPAVPIPGQIDFVQVETKRHR